MSRAVGGEQLAALLAGPAVAIDGALADELAARGHDLRHRLWSARLLAEDPDAIREVHRSYFAAGARVAISASYQASREGFRAEGIEADEADALLRRSVSLAKQARCQSVEQGVPGPLFVAASVGPYGAVLADRSEYRGRYGVGRDRLKAFHAERLEVLATAGPDLLAVETVPDIDEAEVIVELLADHPTVPAWLSYVCADDATTCAGQPFEEAVAVAAAAPTVVAVGVNCTAPQHIEGLLARARSVTDLPLVVYPNGSEGMLPAELVQRWARGGAALVGGCCGLGPSAVRGIAAALADLDDLDDLDERQA